MYILFMYKRQIWAKLAKEIGTDEIVVLTGARQVGKTTTIHWFLSQITHQNKIYFDLENVLERKIFEADNYDSILTVLSQRGLNIKKPMVVALDEIQLVKNLPSVVKYLHDHYPIKFFLSGSSAYYIKNRFLESMAGRKVIYELWPLSFEEFLTFKEMDFVLPQFPPKEIKFDTYAYEALNLLYQEYVTYGGLPKVVLTTDVHRKQTLLQEIFSSYINFDVESLADFKQTRDLRRVISLLAARIGNRVNVSQLAEIAGLSRITVDAYLEFLKASYLIRLLPVFSQSQTIRTRQLEKVYFVDSGIASINSALSEGAAFENSLCHQLSLIGNVSYFFDRQQEIDFVVAIDGREAVAVEAKLTPDSRDVNHVQRLAHKAGIEKSLVVGFSKSAFDGYWWGGMVR
jgi:uncharacterized protein